MSSFPELYFNVDNGYLEGLVRGFKAGVLRQGDYVNLVQCESLEDLKLHLQSTDYGNFLANEASPLTVSVIDDKLKEKMVVEFRHMRNHAYEPLASFLDFITLTLMLLPALRALRMAEDEAGEKVFWYMKHLCSLVKPLVQADC